MSSSLPPSSVLAGARSQVLAEVDASLVDYSLGEPARKLATLIFTQFIKENVTRGHEIMKLVTQGPTTQVTFIGAQA